MLLELITVAMLGQIDMSAMAKSLPRMNGQAPLAGLDAPVMVKRDDRGVPVIAGQAMHDVFRAQGFVHGQERFFQMDGMRRLAAGEVAAIVGLPAVPIDIERRAWRFRAVSRALLAQLPPEHQAMLASYAQGVNAGLADLAAAPPEYVTLNVQPQPWVAEDSLLVMFMMFDVLHFDQRFEVPLSLLKQHVHPDVYEFLTPIATRFDAPLIAGDAPIPRLPGPSVVNLRQQQPLSWRVPIVDWTEFASGSNNWAVAGARSAHGGAMLANDPHLPLGVPNIWYRVELRWPGRRVVGASLPGLPGIVAGSNGDVAWGFTNTMGDFQDLIVVEVDEHDSTRYRTPEGWEAFGEIVERVEVRGGEAVELKLRTTRWGVVTGADPQGRPLVLNWTALHPEMVNLNILRMLEARNVDEAVKVAREWWGPSQNVLMADRSGRIAWTVSGYFPRRVGFDGRTPVSWAQPPPDAVGWYGAAPEDQRPVVIDPADGVLFTANNRTVPVQWARKIGHVYDIGLRASRIRDLLLERPTLNEADMQHIQLDTRSAVHDFYRDLIEQVTAGQDEAALAEARQIAARWNGTADADEVAYRLLRQYRAALHETVISPLVEPVRRAAPGVNYFWMGAEEPVRQVLEARPAHLLPQPFASWDDLLREQLRVALTRFKQEAPSGAQATWGDINRTVIAHIFSSVAPQAMASLLNMPPEPLSGDSTTVRVATQNFGASMRMVVSPGREEQGLFHMPCGQSGHPLSPHYRDGHEAWLKGLPLPLLPGEPVHALRLVPVVQAPP